MVKKPPVNSSEEWSVKRPSDDTVSIISSLHSSPTVSPQGSPRKGALFTLCAFIQGMLHQVKSRPRVDLVKQSSPSGATEKMLQSYLGICLESRIQLMFNYTASFVEDFIVRVILLRLMFTLWLPPSSIKTLFFPPLSSWRCGKVPKLQSDELIGIFLVADERRQHKGRHCQPAQLRHRWGSPPQEDPTVNQAAQSRD